MVIKELDGMDKRDNPARYGMPIIGQSDSQKDSLDRLLLRGKHGKLQSFME